MNLKKKMRQPLDRSAAAKVDNVLGVDRRFLRDQPTQRQSELRYPESSEQSLYVKSLVATTE